MIERVPEHRSNNMPIKNLIAHVRAKAEVLPKEGGQYLGFKLSAEAMSSLRSHVAHELRDLRKKLRGPRLDLESLWQVGEEHYDRIDQFNAEVVEKGWKTY